MASKSSILEDYLHLAYGVEMQGHAFNDTKTFFLRYLNGCVGSKTGCATGLLPDSPYKDEGFVLEWKRDPGYKVWQKLCLLRRMG